MNYLEVIRIFGLVAIMIIASIQSFEIKSLRRRLNILEKEQPSQEDKVHRVASNIKASICYLQYLFKVKRNMLAAEQYEIIPQIQKGIESEAKYIGLKPKDISEDSLYWVDEEDNNDK